MSHIAKINLEVKDLDCLKKSCKELGLQFIEGQKDYKWFGRFVGDSPMPKGLTAEQLGHCDHAIAVPGASYQVGVIKNKNSNSFTLHCDEWSAGGLPRVLGKGAGKLKQEYTRQVTLKAAKMKHLSVKEEREKDGTIRLTLY
jgi:hypothetical protein